MLQQTNNNSYKKKLCTRGKQLIQNVNKLRTCQENGAVPDTPQHAHRLGQSRLGRSRGREPKGLEILTNQYSLTIKIKDDATGRQIRKQSKGSYLPVAAGAP